MDCENDRISAIERLEALLTQESTVYQTTDYLAKMQQHLTAVLESQAEGSSNSKKRKSLASTLSSCRIDSGRRTNHVVNRKWRERICEWYYQVVDHFNINREIVNIATSYMDRYLNVCSETNQTVDEKRFQLLAMTCLFLSLKIHEYNILLIPSTKSLMETVFKLSRMGEDDSLSLERMKEMEYDLLHKLGWLVHPPTSHTWLNELLKHEKDVRDSFFVFSSNAYESYFDKVYDTAHFVLELSVMDYFFVSYQPSVVAMAAILFSTDEVLSSSSSPSSNNSVKIEHNANFTSLRLDPCSPSVEACRRRLARIYYDTQNLNNEERSVDEGVSQPRTMSPVSVIEDHNAFQVASQNAVLRGATSSDIHGNGRFSSGESSNNRSEQHHNFVDEETQPMQNRHHQSLHSSGIVSSGSESNIPVESRRRNYIDETKNGMIIVVEPECE